MMGTDDIQNLFNACGAAGYTPQGDDDRARVVDACNYISNNTAPIDERELWDIATASCVVVAAFMAGTQ